MIRAQIPNPRYLACFDTRVLGHLYTDCLVIGAGIGGLRAALSAAEAGQVLLLVKEGVSDSNTYYAQGGIAAVLPENDDDVALHIEDTLRTGCGLCDAEVVDLAAGEHLPVWRQLLAKLSGDAPDVEKQQELIGYDYDGAFPLLIRYLTPQGLRGFVLAALMGAVISSLASMLNAASTIFTMDIYKEYVNKEASQVNLVWVGRGSREEIDEVNESRVIMT